MALRPICEPVELPPGTSVIAERVVVEPDSADVGNFPHFHDVAELVLFRRVSGMFLADGCRHRLDDGAMVFVPSMRHHDFALDAGPMEWVLVQVDPYLIEAIGLAQSKLAQPFCGIPHGAMRARIDFLSDWLVEAVGGDDPSAERILELLLVSVAEIGETQSSTQAQAPPVERLLPALERLRTAPADAISLQTAATLCRVSPAYFSRRFRQLFGMTFTDYARTYRLRLAARRLASGGAAISEIAYGAGFSSPAHFTARFRERFGMTPREYRASARKRAGGQGGN
jgi:AraC-like DNA-binding protein